MTMDNDPNLMNGNQDELFADAIERVEAGESISDVLISIPESLRQEMSEMLDVFSVTQQIRNAPIPPLSPTASAQGRQDFLAAAAVMRTESANETTKQEGPIIGLLAALWIGLQSLFDRPGMRLAPIGLALGIALVSSAAIIDTLRSGLPGDLLYPINEWVAYQQYEMAREEQKDEILDRQAREIAREIMLVADREADNNSAVIEASAVLRLNEIGMRRYKVGEISVAPQYQKNANVEIYSPMEIEGNLEEGSVVLLVYRILPGQTGGEGPALVQGVSMKVLDAPALEPEPEAAPDSDAQELTDQELNDDVEDDTSSDGLASEEQTAEDEKNPNVAEVADHTPEPSASTARPGQSTPPGRGPIAGPSCGNSIPAGWKLRTVVRGDTLSGIAKDGTVVGELKRANCLDDDKIIAGETIWAPPPAKPQPNQGSGSSNAGGSNTGPGAGSNGVQKDEPQDRRQADGQKKEDESKPDEETNTPSGLSGTEATDAQAAGTEENADSTAGGEAQQEQPDDTSLPTTQTLGAETLGAESNQDQEDPEQIAPESAAGDDAGEPSQEGSEDTGEGEAGEGEATEEDGGSAEPAPTDTGSVEEPATEEEQSGSSAEDSTSESPEDSDTSETVDGSSDETNGGEAVDDVGTSEESTPADTATEEDTAEEGTAGEGTAAEGAVSRRNRRRRHS